MIYPLIFRTSHNYIPDWFIFMTGLAYIYDHMIFRTKFCIPDEQSQWSYAVRSFILSLIAMKSDEFTERYQAKTLLRLHIMCLPCFFSVTIAYYVLAVFASYCIMCSSLLRLHIMCLPCLQAIV